MGSNEDVLSVPRLLTDEQITELKREALETLQKEQAAGRTSKDSGGEPVSAGIDRVFSRQAALRSRTVTSGTFLGFTIGDSQTQAIANLRALGAQTVSGDNSQFEVVSSAKDLSHLETYPGVILHPSDIRITFDGDRVTAVSVPPASRSLPVAAQLAKAATRSQAFSLIAQFLEGDRSRWIERVDPTDHIVSLLSGDPFERSNLAVSPVWLAAFQDNFHNRWDLTLSFDGQRKLMAFVVLVSAP
jgi:hypothetical protein